MLVFLLTYGFVERFCYTPQCQKELCSFSQEAKEDLILLISRYLAGERLPVVQFKTFSLSKNEKIQEFKGRDRIGSWRVFAFLGHKGRLTFIYAFRKKSQKLLQKDKKIIIKRIKGLRNG